MTVSNLLLRAFGISTARRAVESVVPRRTFDEVILPPPTRRALDQALVQIGSHDLIFNQWLRGGDIRNVVLKAALAAAAQPGSDHQKRISQQHVTARIQGACLTRIAPD